jgi:inhibitor of KinA
LSEADVISLHSAGRYEVRAMGFLPGFGYLAGMAQRLFSPRRGTPRTRVPAGSVGIAGIQTGVYPLESPGGWQLIGRTPMRMFRPEAKRYSVLQVGDAVRFEPMSEREFASYREGGA